MCAPYFVKEHFSVKTLLFFVHLHLQQKRAEKVISSYQIYSVAISTLLFDSSNHKECSICPLSVQRRHKPTDDASIRRWRGSQQTGAVRTTRRFRRSCSSATSLTMLWYTRCMPCFGHFFPVSAVQKLLKSVKIWLSCSQMYTATFYEPRQKCRF